MSFNHVSANVRVTDLRTGDGGVGLTHTRSRVAAIEAAARPQSLERRVHETRQKGYALIERASLLSVTLKISEGT